MNSNKDIFANYQIKAKRSTYENQIISSILALTFALALTGCSNSVNTAGTGEVTAISSEVTEKSYTEESSSLEDTPGSAADSAAAYPITIQHAFGETVIQNKPERIVTISWGNHDVPLALGVIPVGVSEANYGVTDGSGLLPWTKEGFKNLGVENPVLFKDTDGLDFEAISDAQPDVILAAYSGITQEEYALLSGIAPVVAYPTFAWQTYWRDQITMNATGMGMKEAGDQLVTDLEQLISKKTNEYRQIKDKRAAFFYFSPTDLGKFYIYLPTDPRAAFLNDLGMTIPESVLTLAEGSTSFAIELSAEKADILEDVDIIITYGDATLLEDLQADSLLKAVPAIQKGSVVLIQDGTPLAASGTPSALSIPATLDEYLKLIGEAANKAE